MAASLSGPGSLAIQPDPVLTNVMADSSLQGGWAQDIMAPVKAVVKDFVRYGKRDTQSLLGALIDTVRTPGALPNKLNRAITQWLTAVIGEQALRVEVPQEDIDNSPSPEMPLMDAGVMIQNGLRMGIESLCLALMNAADTITWPTSGAQIRQSAAAAPWRGSGTQIQKECGDVRIACRKNGGLAPNTVLISPNRWPGVWASDEVQKAIGAGFREDVLAMNGGLPPSFFGYKLLVPGARTDTVPTGTFTPAFVWDDDYARFFCTPSPNGEPWNGADPTAFGQYENQKNGTAFEGRTMLDPLNAMNGITHVWGNVRRSAPIAFNPDHAYILAI